MKEETQTKLQRDASEAIKVVANAAAEATKIVAAAAAEATKVTNSKYLNDHDLLIELKTKMDGLRDDVKNISDGTSKQISDHETRINGLEDSKTKQNTAMSIGIGILSLLTSLLIYHLIG